MYSNFIDLYLVIAVTVTFPCFSIAGRAVRWCHILCFVWGNRWDQSRPPTIDNLVLLTFDEVSDSCHSDDYFYGVVMPLIKFWKISPFLFSWISLCSWVWTRMNWCLSGGSSRIDDLGGFSFWWMGVLFNGWVCIGSCRKRFKLIVGSQLASTQTRAARLNLGSCSRWLFKPSPLNSWLQIPHSADNRIWGGHLSVCNHRKDKSSHAGVV